MTNRRVLLLLASFGLLFVLLVILLFYQRTKESSVLSQQSLEDPVQLVEQIESEVDLFRQFQQERGEAIGSVSERLIVDNLIQAQKDKIESLIGLARVRLKLLGVQEEAEVIRLRAELAQKEKELEAASGLKAEQLQVEIHTLKHKLEALELKSEQANPALGSRRGISNAQTSLIQSRLKSISKSIEEASLQGKVEGGESTRGMWADLMLLLGTGGRSNRIKHYQQDVERQHEVVFAYLNRLWEEHQSLLQRLAQAGVGQAQQVTLKVHQDSAEMIESLRALNAVVDEQLRLLARWRDTLWRDSTDIALRLLVRILGLAMVIVAILLLSMLLGKVPDRFVHDEKSRYYSRKIIHFVTVFAVIMSAVFALLGQFIYLGPVIGLVGAGLAIALQDVIVSIVGWFFIIGRLGLSVGDRVEINDVKGDVIDIGVFRTVLLEVGNWVQTEQATGRVVFFPNSFVFRNHFFNYHIGSRFIWDEITVTLTYESNWRKAKEALLRIAEEAVAPDIQAAEQEMRTMARRFLLKVGKLTPIVYTQMADSGVSLVVRYVTPVRARRTYFDDITEKILSYIESQPDVELAYPTRRNLQEPVPHVESPKEVHRKRTVSTVADRPPSDVAPIQERTSETLEEAPSVTEKD
ncbi:MAG TPA: mechanosensitive ion channel domain-containing protein [Acidobacteriota bacterium]|jgi:small-conductance mechanosensitive channel